MWRQINVYDLQLEVQLDYFSKKNIRMTKLFLAIAKLEGISLLLLLGLAMPLKYYYGQPQYVQHIGMAHGVLFIAYIILGAYLFFTQSWPLKKWIFVSVASILPFGTFYIEYHYFRQHKHNIQRQNTKKNNT
jgi:integral membrane protein